MNVKDRISTDGQIQAQSTDIQLCNRLCLLHKYHMAASQGKRPSDIRPNRTRSKDQSIEMCHANFPSRADGLYQATSTEYKIQDRAGTESLGWNFTIKKRRDDD
jgi:hypothetical protein